MKRLMVLAAFLSFACVPSFAQDPDKDKPPKPPQEQPDKSKPQPKPDERKPDERKQQEPPPKPDERRQQPPQKPEERKPEDRKPQEPPAKPDERRPQQPNERPQPNRQEPDRSQPEHQQADRPQREHQETRGNRPAPPPPRGDARDARSSRRVPDDRYRSEFGREHHFRVRFENDQPRFAYGGYYWEYLEPWPVDWDYYDDDFYIDYEADNYYLYDLDHPRTRIIIILVG